MRKHETQVIYHHFISFYHQQIWTFETTGFLQCQVAANRELLMRPANGTSLHLVVHCIADVMLIGRAQIRNPI